MKTEIKKWGNSAALRLPTTVMKQCHLTVGSTVNLTVQDGKLVVESEAMPEYALDELLASCTPEKMALGQEDRIWVHQVPVGKEVV